MTLHHILHEPYGGAGGSSLAALPLAAGVDVFFVVSGFVMVHASGPLFGAAGAWRVFLRRRLARIVPLYWAATTAFLLVALLLPRALNTPPPGAAEIAASYAFLPWPRADGLIQPLFSLGWTLNYEMFFYALFALFLPLSRTWAVGGVALALGVAVLAGRWLHPAQPALVFWSNPIVVEFAFGMGLALLAERGMRLSGAARWGLAALGLALLWLAPDDGAPIPRFGPGAVALVAAATLGAAPRLPAWLADAMERLGDASYALYLTHPFVMRATTLAWAKLTGGASPVVPSVAPSVVPLAAILASAAALLLAIGLALAVHAWFEAPVTRALARPRPAPARAARG